MLSGNNLSGVAVQFATQFGANATQSVTIVAYIGPTMLV